MQDLFYRLGISLAIGLLIGAERGWVARQVAEGGRTAGLRTLALSGLFGGVGGALAKELEGGGVMLGLLFLAFAGMVGIHRYREMVHDKTFGITTIVAAYLAFALGALAVVGDERVAAAAGVAVTGLLALKAALHAWLRRLTWEELRAGILLLAMTLILLPLLPDREMGPFGALNPHDLWLMSILIAVVSATGYVAMKWGGGEKGIVLSGIAGGFVSSTAVTLSFAKLARETPAREAALVAGALLAGTTMMGRVLLIAGSVNPQIVRWLLLPLLLATVSGLGAAAWFYWRGSDRLGSETLRLKNPFELSTVLKFTAFLAFVMVAAKAMTQWAGDAGAFALALVSGVADVDAITLSLSQLGGGALGEKTAACAILLAAGVNTVAKAVLAWIAGGRGPGLKLGLGALVQLAAGGAGLAITLALDPFAAFVPQADVTPVPGHGH
ncbi:MAG: MgtC/SapB family protein [Hyphomicrobium sp.]|jgi:uncharacterized membrane protein (DUF4010 family)